MTEDEAKSILDRHERRKRFGHLSYHSIGTAVAYKDATGAMCIGEVEELKPGEPYPYKIRNVNYWLSIADIQPLT